MEFDYGTICVVTDTQTNTNYYFTFNDSVRFLDSKRDWNTHQFFFKLPVHN